MPYATPTLSWFHIRDFCEKFSWRDPSTGIVTEGYTPPSSVARTEVQRVPFTIKYITSKGVVESGRCICLKVNRRKHMRLVMFVDSNEIRWIRDYLVLEISGTRFVTRSISE